MKQKYRFFFLKELIVVAVVAATMISPSLATLTTTSISTTTLSATPTTTIAPVTSIATSKLAPTPAETHLKGPVKICTGVHIRNDLKSFEQLSGCNVIDGPLTIALVSNQTHPYEPKDYENITFPDLIEVTEYLLFFRVQGLSTLSKLFPNLTVIRGKELVSNYALIIYEMMHLQKINLSKLTDILRGSVRIESNPNLCYVSTVNWDAICKRPFTPHFIKENNAGCNNRCPDHCRPWRLNQEPGRLQGDVTELGAENNRSLFCWNSHQCQEPCQMSDGTSLPMGPNGGCCSPQCAGGCYLEGRSDQCFSCRYVLQADNCVDYCDSNLFEYKSRCIDEEACILMVETPPQNPQCISRLLSAAPSSTSSTSNFKPIKLPDDKHGRCQTSCPPGYEEDSTNKNKCKPCDKGKCRKVCTPQGNDKPFMVTNVNSLRELSGCNAINGSLEISMKGGKNVLLELEKAFQELEEIKGYLKITRSYPIITLGFLSRLKAINGSELERKEYSLIIIDNPNLQELFMFNRSDSDQKQLKIESGKIFVHLNPKLCPHRINNLKTYALVKDWDERDVSVHTNGDKEACNTQKLEVEFLHGTSRVVMIRFQNFALTMDDPRSLLYYLVNYREVKNGTVSMFDGRDGCNSQNDVWITMEESPLPNKPFSNKTDPYQEVFIKVKPATRYALYVKTFTILAGSTGAMSDIIYFETAPDTPGIPKQIESLAKSDSSVVVSWSSPSKPNGIIDRYSITITKIPELEDLQNLDICESIDNRDKITKSLTKDEPSKSALIPPNQSNGTNSIDSSSSLSGVAGSTSSSPSTCARATSDNDVDIQAEVVTFQDMIIDIVYLKQPCATPPKRKRSIEYDYDDSETRPQSNIMRNSIDSPTIFERSNQILKSEDNHTSISTLPTTHAVSTIKFDRILGKTQVNITASREKPDVRSSFLISDLEHFSLYTIEVVACHGEFVGNNTKPAKTYSACSLQAITQVRTLPIEEYDKILTETIVFNPANESSSLNRITWKKPEKPNGLVLAYRVRYRPKASSSDIWTEACINNATYQRDGGFVLTDINPGTYLFSVQTVSMLSGQRYWSLPELEFEIPENYLISPVVTALLVAIGLAILMIGVASGTYFYQKKRHELAYASVNPDYVQYDPDEWEVDKNNLIIGAQIGTGAFGLVFKGQLTTEKGSFSCAIKTVPPTSTAKQRMDFLREASIMKQFDTYHVVKLMGVVSTTTPVYVIMEFMENGDLKSFLRSLRDAHQRDKKPLVDGIYLMAAQIADGMAYLVSKKFVHRDLAARNCMVGENGVVKIGDFGLTRDIYVNDYYRRDTQGRLPVRWMAPESLSDNLYTSASDVWSYGIVVWEIVTFSAYPYQGLSNDEVITRVTQGGSMSRPDNCPDKLYHIMEMCWRRNDRDRPSFHDIVEYLLPETEDKLLPNCFYRKHNHNQQHQKTQQQTATITGQGDSIAQSIPEENVIGGESYPLLLYPSQNNNNNNRANGLTNGVNHHHRQINPSEVENEKLPLA